MLTISVAAHLLVSAALLSRRSFSALLTVHGRSLQTPLPDPVARFSLYAYAFSRPPLCVLTAPSSLLLCSTDYPPSYQDIQPSTPRCCAELAPSLYFIMRPPGVFWILLVAACSPIVHLLFIIIAIWASCHVFHCCSVHFIFTFL